MKKLILFIAVALLISRISFAETINGAGASFPYPVYSSWAKQYYKKTGIKINYQSIGSGGGIRQITARTVDFGGTDKPLKPEKLESSKLFQFPAVMGGVVPVINIKGIKAGELKLTPSILADIFLGRIKKWNDSRIVKINPNLKLPSSSITVVHRSDGSGTTAIFTTYLSQVSPIWKNKVGAGKSVKWPTGRGGKKNDGVASYIKRIKNSIGYVEFAYAKRNSIPFVKLQNQDGNFVNPSFDTFKEAASYAKWDKNKGYYLWLVNAPGKNSWPIVGATFILIPKEKTEKDKKVVKFFDWIFKNGDSTAEKLIYVPLPKTLKENIRDYWSKNGIY
jgi:phosphate transport system substrate-binding protein